MRYSLVPWLSLSDFEPAGQAAWAIEIFDSIALGWVVESPWGKGDSVMVIRAMKGNGKDGGVITLALRDSIDIDTTSLPVRNIQHSRTFFDDGA